MWESLSGTDQWKIDIRTALVQRFPQAVLLNGASYPQALAVAAGLLCTTSVNPPCGSCASCQKIIHQSHPDFIQINETGEIKVDMARKICQEAVVLPNDGTRKVFLIEHADRMNIRAQNALLKLLEEPPRYVFFILTTTQPGLLLQTVRSRCTIYHIAPTSSEPIRTDALEPIRFYLQALANRNEYEMLQIANDLVSHSKQEFVEILSVIQMALRDALLAHTQVPPLLPMLAQESKSLHKLSVSKLLALCNHFQTLSVYAEGNASTAIQCAAMAAGAYVICQS